MLRVCLVVSVVMGLIMTYVHDSLRGYLICSKREEFLRFNLEDFWISTPYDGSRLSNLPIYHPYNILSDIICKHCTGKYHESIKY